MEPARDGYLFAAVVVVRCAEDVAVQTAVARAISGFLLVMRMQTDLSSWNCLICRHFGLLSPQTASDK